MGSDATASIGLVLAAALRGRLDGVPVIPSDADPDLPYTVADDRLMDAMGDEGAHR